MLASQSNRSIGVDTVLGPDVLLLAAVKATERLSQPFEYDLELLSERIDINAGDLLGTPATVSLQLPSGDRRYFSGYIRSFSQAGFEGTFARYRANLAPWLWFLSRTADCRIFQEQSVPDIVKSIFREHGFSDFEERLSGSYRQWTYCVQYRETDLNFIQRLLEHEGIYYFHEHQDGKHTLVLADSYSAHSPAPGYEEVVFYPPGQEPVPELERIDEWSVAHEVRSGVFAHTAFDFTVPRKDLLARRSAPKDHALAEEEVFDFQNDYTDSSEGDGYARIRLEERQADHEVARAACNARGLTCGGLFTLKEHPRSDQNREYLILSASYRLQSDDYGSVDAAPGECPVYRCRLTAIDAQVPYRPPCRTPKPLVQGPQTAIVVGKSGEEIWTDRYGRVKVQFHWDRYGKEDESSSCWVRVSHPWAGKGWGAVSIPRIGQEVIVDFLEGDPDQPIITGRVYNGDCMPPFALPDGAVVSGIKSDTHKGSGYNEISMNDTAGQEQVTTHAQFDMNTTVEHDQTTTVHNNRTATVDVDDTLTVTGNRTMHVIGALSETIDGGQEVTISSGYTETISGGATSDISGGLTSTVDGTWDNTVNGHLQETVTSGAEVNITGELTETIDGPISRSASGTIDIHADGAGTFTSSASLELSVGGSSVKITAADVTISSNGSTIKVDASGVSVNGAKISLNG